MSNVSVDPVQGGILLAFLSFVVKFMYDVKAMMKEKNEERERALLEERKNHSEELKAISESLKVFAEKMTLMEERTQWMIRRDRPPTPDTGYSHGRERQDSETFRKSQREAPRARLYRDSSWTPVRGVEVEVTEKSRRKTGEDDDR